MGALRPTNHVHENATVKTSTGESSALIITQANAVAASRGPAIFRGGSAENDGLVENSMLAGRVVAGSAHTFHAPIGVPL